MRIAALMHVPHEGAGNFNPAFEACGVSIKEFRLWEKFGSAEAGEVRKFDALLAMGGPMNVYEEEKHSFLRPETALIRELVLAGKPYLGICLGSQLLAKALGARVYKNKVKEVGAGIVELTSGGEKDALFSGLTKKMPVMHWHEDTFDLPEKSVLLATGSECKNQAFKFGKAAYALQFHLDATAEMIGVWADEHEKIGGDEKVKFKQGLAKAKEEAWKYELEAKILARNFVGLI